MRRLANRQTCPTSFVRNPLPRPQSPSTPLYGVRTSLCCKRQLAGLAPWLAVVQWGMVVTARPERRESAVKAPEAKVYGLPRQSFSGMRASVGQARFVGAEIPLSIFSRPHPVPLVCRQGRINQGQGRDRAEKPVEAPDIAQVATWATLPRSGPQGVDNGARCSGGRHSVALVPNDWCPRARWMIRMSTFSSASPAAKVWRKPVRVHALGDVRLSAESLEQCSERRTLQGLPRVTC